MHQYELDPEERPSEGVYSLVAVVEDRSPMDLTPLGDTIDPDALNGLLRTAHRGVQVRFRYCGYDLVATTETVRIEEPT